MTQGSPVVPAACVAVRLGANTAVPAAKYMRTRGPRVSFRVGHQPNGRVTIHSQMAPPWDAIMRSPTISLRASRQYSVEAQQDADWADVEYELRSSRCWALR